MAPTPNAVRDAVKASGVSFELCDGWDNPANRAYGGGVWDPQYVLLHHTANSGAGGNNPSLNWVLHNQYAPVRACNFLIGRDGTVYVVYALGAYHAGLGGPGRWGDGPYVNQDAMNHYAWGIEIESKGTSKKVTAVDGITPAQFEAASRLTASLLDLMSPTVSTERAINHRTWAPGRKSDTKYSLKRWHPLIEGYRQRNQTPLPAPGEGGEAAPRVLKVGSTGPAVRMLRRALGQRAGNRYSRFTARKVDRFVRKNPRLLPADGTCGPKTYRAITGKPL